MMGLNNIQFFLTKRWLFYILDFALKRLKKQKRKKSQEALMRTDEIKYNSENLDILYSIVLK